MRKKSTHILTGQYRLTPIFVPSVPNLHPTLGRIRESLFNWLNFLWKENFSDKDILDLFAGSGSLGFEAASRGARYVRMIEKNKIASLALISLQKKLGAYMVSIHNECATKIIEHFNTLQFDLILLDPPFNQTWFPDILEKILPILTKNGLIYTESRNIFPIPSNFSIIRYKKIGSVHFHLLCKSDFDS